MFVLSSEDKTAFYCPRFKHKKNCFLFCYIGSTSVRLHSNRWGMSRSFSEKLII